MSGAGSGDGGVALVEVLKAIAADYDRAATDEERRALGQEQLRWITQHLQGAGIPGDALRPATAIVHGLIDLDRGCRPPILRPHRKPGGQPVLSDDLRQRGLIAASVTLFMRADTDCGHGDQKLDRAVRKVARRVECWRVAHGRRVTKTGRQSLPEAIKDWRESAMRGRPGEDADACAYASALEEKPDGATPAAWAEWLLTDGRKLYR